MKGRAGGCEDRVSRVDGGRELVLGRRGRGCQGGCTQISLQRPPLTLPILQWEVGAPHLRGGAPHQEPEEGMGGGYCAGFSIHRGHSHHHHGV